MARDNLPEEIPFWKLVWIALLLGSVLSAIILYFFNR
jgi:hypothetical protein